MSKTQQNIVKELTPELAEKIWNDIQRKLQRQRDAKEVVLHHLKQLKAEMGRVKAKGTNHKFTVDAIALCMDIIDKKITKINNDL